MNHRDPNMPAHRDTDAPAVKITREIRLEWVLGVIASIALQAMLLWTGQRTQAEAIAAQSETIKNLTSEVKSMRDDRESDRIKATDQAGLLRELDRRVTALENQHHR